MSEILSAARPDFFGKDSFVPFIGKVENVNDPTHSGRVKVRCVAWHPHERDGGGDDSLPTDDLPWARVAMPTTHAQTSRIGGKHGLLVGSMVIGFFFDGEEAQDPIIFATLNFTSKASDKDNRTHDMGEDGKMPQGTPGFAKGNSAEKLRNTQRITTKEQGTKGYSDPADIAGDGVTNASDNPDCGGKAELQSEAEAASMEEFRNPENPSGKNWNNTVADGR